MPPFTVQGRGAIPAAFATLFLPEFSIAFDGDLYPLLPRILPLLLVGILPRILPYFWRGFCHGGDRYFTTCFARKFWCSLSHQVHPQMPPDGKIHFFKNRHSYPHRTLFRFLHFPALFRNLHNSVVDKSVQNSLLVSKSGRRVSKSRNSVEIAPTVINIGFGVKPLFNTNQHSVLPIYGKVLFCILRIFAYVTSASVTVNSHPLFSLLSPPFTSDFITDFCPPHLSLKSIKKGLPN